MLEGGNTVLSLVWALICVVAIIGLAYWFTRHVVSRMGSGFVRTSGTGRLNVLAQLSLGKDQRLLLVQAGERYFLLGATPAGIANLAEFTPEEADAWREKAEGPGDGQPPSFREALKTVLKQKWQR